MLLSHFSTLALATQLVTQVIAPTSAQASAQALPGRVAVGIGTVEVLPALVATLATRGGEQVLELERVKQSLDGQLTAAVGATAKFDVIARNEWPQLVREQDFATSGNVDTMDAQAAKSFALRGIRWLIIPQIADFQDYIETAHFEALGQKMARRLVKLALVTKVFETTTGRLIESVNSHFDDQSVVNDPTNTTVQGGRFTDSMILAIARSTAEKVAYDIVDRLMPAKILAITDRVATMSRGAGAGVVTGQVWQVFAQGKPLVDPDTNESIGSEEISVGWIQIQSADARSSRGGVCGEDFGVAPGCIVRLSTQTICPAGAGAPASLPAHGEQMTPGAAPLAAPATLSQPAAGAGAPAPTTVKRYTAAIFVKNRPADVAPEKVMVLEDYIAAQVDRLCFTTVSREDTLNAVAKFAAAGANAGTYGGGGVDPQKDLDRLLSDETSALRLAQQMGVDYILIASITAYINDRIDSEAYGTTTSIRSAQMDVTYRLLGRAEGQVITSDSVTATEKIRESPTLQQKRDLIDVVIRRCAQSVGDSVAKRCGESILTGGATLPDNVSFRVMCTMQDMSIPGVVTDPATGRYVVSGVNWNLLPTNASVELDGIVVGSAPEQLSVFPGLHKVTVSCEGFRPWSRTVNVHAGMTLTVPLQLTDEGLLRWRAQLQFMQALTQAQQLTDADVEMIRATAEFIRNSRVVLDMQNSTTINTNQPPTYIVPGWWPSSPQGAMPGATPGSIVP